MLDNKNTEKWPLVAAWKAGSKKACSGQGSLLFMRFFRLIFKKNKLSLHKIRPNIFSIAHRAYPVNPGFSIKRIFCVFTKWNMSGLYIIPIDMVGKIWYSIATKGNTLGANKQSAPGSELFGGLLRARFRHIDIPSVDGVLFVTVPLSENARIAADPGSCRKRG